MGLYREKYSGLNVQHFTGKAARAAQHPAELHVDSNGAARSRPGEQGTLARGAPSAAGAAAVAGHAVACGRQPPPLVLDHRWYDLLVVLNVSSSTSEVYYAQLVEQESDAHGRRRPCGRVGERRSAVPLALDSDCASHFFVISAPGRESRSRAADASGTGAERVGHADDSGLLAAGPLVSVVGEFRDLAGALAAGVASEGHHHGGESQPVFARGISRAEFNRRFCVPPVRWKRVPALPAARSAFSFFPFGTSAP